MAKIIHFSTAHSVRDTRVFWKECCTLANAGHEVELYAVGERDEWIEGVRVKSLSQVPRFMRMTCLAAGLLRKLVSTDADVYHFHDPELIPVGLVLKSLGRCVVYDVHENLPQQVMTKDWVPKPFRPLVSCITAGLEVVAMSQFKGIVAATPAIARRFPPGKTATVQNFPIEREISVQQTERSLVQRPLNAIYVGGATRIRGTMQVVDAFEIVSQRIDANLTVVGSIAPASFERELLARPGWSAVQFCGWCDRARVSELMGESRLGVVTFLKAPNHMDSQPNKLFEYMAAGLPVVASDFEHWRQIVGDTGCGILVDPESPSELARAIEWLLTNPEEAEEMGRRGRAAVINEFNWESQGRGLLDFYSRIIDEDIDRRGCPAAIRESGGCEPGTRSAA